MRVRLSGIALACVAVVFAFGMGMAATSFAANGSPAFLGQKNVARALTTFAKQGPGPVFRFVVREGQAPFTVNSSGRVANLNADKVDGLDASKLRGQRGPQGEKGDTGERGLQGEDGEDGTNGKDGVDGDDGAPGEDGDDGAPGVSMLYTKTSQWSTQITQSGGSKLLLTLDLPAGESYYVQGSASSSNIQNRGPIILTCGLYDNEQSFRQYQIGPPRSQSVYQGGSGRIGAGAVSFDGAITTTEDTRRVYMYCSILGSASDPENGANTLDVFRPSVHAIRVDDANIVDLNSPE